MGILYLWTLAKTRDPLNSQFSLAQEASRKSLPPSSVVFTYNTSFNTMQKWLVLVYP